MVITTCISGFQGILDVEQAVFLNRDTAGIRKWFADQIEENLPISEKYSKSRVIEGIIEGMVIQDNPDSFLKDFEEGFSGNPWTFDVIKYMKEEKRKMFIVKDIPSDELDIVFCCFLV